MCTHPPAKVLHAAAHVRRVNEWTDVAPVHADLAALTPAVLDGVDAAIVGLDGHAARLLAARLLMAARVPYVDLGTLAAHWHGRVSVCDPAGVVDGACGERSCVACGWGTHARARAGVDRGMPCDVASPEPAWASSLHVASAVAAVGVREVLALVGACDLRPSVGCEIRADLGRLRVERFDVPADEEGCAADHVLASADCVPLDATPDALTLRALALHCGIAPGEEVVLVAPEIVRTAVCTRCYAPSHPYVRSDAPLPRCARCGAGVSALQRTRRLRWRELAHRAGAIPASQWWRPGDRFAVVGRAGVRVYGFRADPLPWDPGRPWDAALAARRYRRLPAPLSLDRIRKTRLAFIGVGHVGGAALHQLAVLPFGGLVIVDRDVLELHNLPSSALATNDALRALPGDAA